MASQRAFSAIFDSNVCTAVTSTLLYYFGSGPVKGFALTLLIGVAISMFTAIVVSRTFLLLLVRGQEKPNLSAVGHQAAVASAHERGQVAPDSGTAFRCLLSSRPSSSPRWAASSPVSTLPAARN